MSGVARHIGDTRTLNDGVELPVFGFGLGFTQFGAEHGPQGEEAIGAVTAALQAGYRLIDTGEKYANEKEVVEAINRAGLKREDVFVASKVWITKHGFDQCKQVIEEGAKSSGLGYYDCYMIHAPNGGKLVETYDAILECKKQGLVRSVGVSNFGVQHLEGLAAAGRPKPSVNEIEQHPWQPNKRPLVEYCRQNNIAIIGHSSLTKGKMLDDPRIQTIADKYEKTTAQVILRWNIEHNITPLPKSLKPVRVRSNAECFDFSLTQEELDSMDTYESVACSWDPTIRPWEG